MPRSKAGIAAPMASRWYGPQTCPRRGRRSRAPDSPAPAREPRSCAFPNHGARLGAIALSPRMGRMRRDGCHECKPSSARRASTRSSRQASPERTSVPARRDVQQVKTAKTTLGTQRKSRPPDVPENPNDPPLWPPENPRSPRFRLGESPHPVERSRPASGSCRLGRLSTASLALEQRPHVTKRARRKSGGLEAGASELIRFGREPASAVTAVDPGLVAEHAERFLNQFGQREEFV